MKHLHVTGCGRSGTTLLLEMMRASFRCDESSKHEQSILETPPTSPSTMFTKHPGEVAFLRPLLAADPDLGGVYIYRDPRSVICSIHAKAADCYATNFSSWLKEQMHAKYLMSHPRFVEVRYEELITDPDNVQAKIHKTFPLLEATGQFSSYHERARPSEGAVQALNGFREVDRERLHAWRNHLSRVKEQLASHPGMARILIELGYEEDTTWTSLLPEVQVCRHKVWEEKGVNLLKRFDQWQRRTRKLRRRLALLSSTGSSR